jgi:long-chain acyl-CoA synthetase
MLNLISSIVRGFKFSDQDKQLAFLPFGHTASINYNILPALLTGCDLYISNGFEFLRSNFFSTLSDCQITYVEIVPTVLFMLNKLKIDVSNLNLSSLSFIGCGSSTLPLGAQKEFINQYNIGVGNLYGLSETGPTHIDDPREKNWQPGSIGFPLDVNECKVSEDGELLIKGDNVFIGYYKNNNLYEDVVVNGWFQTGDLGYMDNGRHYFSDRKKDLIIKGGINIVPMEIEEVIYKHSEILECVVVGREDSIHGEEVVAVCVKNGSITEENLSKEILEICRAELSSYKIPKQIYFWEELPKTASHKLLRKDVREKINKLSVR